MELQSKYYITRKRYFFFIVTISGLYWLLGSLGLYLNPLLPETQGVRTLQYLYWASLITLSVAHYNLTLKRLRTLKLHSWLAIFSFYPATATFLGILLLLRKDPPFTYSDLNKSETISHKSMRIIIVDLLFLSIITFFSYVDIETYTIPSLGLLATIVTFVCLNQFFLKRDMFGLITKFFLLGCTMVLLEMFLNKSGFLIGAGDLIIISLLPLIEEGDRLKHLVVQCCKVLIIGIGFVAFGFTTKIALVPFITIGYLIHLIVKYKHFWKLRHTPDFSSSLKGVVK